MAPFGILVSVALAAGCAWWLLWGGSRPAGPRRVSAMARRGASTHAPTERGLRLFALLSPLLGRVEQRILRRIGGAGLQAVLTHDQAALVRGGLQDVLDARGVLALRILLAVLLLSLFSLSLLVWSAASSLARLPPMSDALFQLLIALAIIASGLGGLWPGHWLSQVSRARQRSIQRALPFVLDLLTLSVESGASLALALSHAADKGPEGPLREELSRMLEEVKTGRARSEALRAMAERIDLPAVTHWVAAMISAQQQGSSLGPLMRAQAEQRRHERFLHAEKLAMKAPVKMLFPLLVFIFPCTFLLLFFPVVVRLLQEGVLR